MSIATSIEKLSETLTNCKTNLKEKEVADVDNIKISDVDEKIAEIKSGGGSGFKLIENVFIDDNQITSSSIYNQYATGDNYFSGELKFTPKEDIGFFYYCDSFDRSRITNKHELSDKKWNSVTRGTEYTFTFNSINSSVFFVFLPFNLDNFNYSPNEADFIAIASYY